LVTRNKPITIRNTPAITLTYFTTLEAFLINIKIKLMKMDMIINGKANPAE
jgi:hypothetical protein